MNRFAIALGLLLGVAASAHAQQKKPNILVIWGDDIGNQNISHNSRGMMGYQPPMKAARPAVQLCWA